MSLPPPLIAPRGFLFGLPIPPLLWYADPLAPRRAAPPSLPPFLTSVVAIMQIPMRKSRAGNIIVPISVLLQVFGFTIFPLDIQSIE